MRPHLSLAILLAATLACGSLTNPTVVPTEEAVVVPPTAAQPETVVPPATEDPPTPVLATATTLPTTAPPVPLRLGAGVDLLGQAQTEENATIPYIINTNTPVLVGPSDPRLTNFNVGAVAQVQALVTSFKANFAANFPTPDPTLGLPGSSLNINYQLRSPAGRLVSVQLAINEYMSGAAHPNYYVQALNYDLETGQPLTLENLFAPDSAGLEVVAAICQARLTEQALISFPEGAAPTPENYQNWFITTEGLLAVFNPYQVAPYAVGAPEVLIPWAELPLAPDSPVQELVP